MNLLTIHDILADIPVNVSCGGADDTLTITLRLEYTCRPEWPADATHPGARAEFTLISAIMVDTEGPEPTDTQIREWAQDWLDGDGYDAAYGRAR